MVGGGGEVVVRAIDRDASGRARERMGGVLIAAEVWLVYGGLKTCFTVLGIRVPSRATRLKGAWRGTRLSEFRHASQTT